jgi:hypothetical protein
LHWFFFPFLFDLISFSGTMPQLSRTGDFGLFLLQTFSRARTHTGIPVPHPGSRWQKFHINKKPGPKYVNFEKHFLLRLVSLCSLVCNAMLGQSDPAPCQPAAGFFFIFIIKKIRIMALKPQCQPTAGFLFIF